MVSALLAIAAPAHASPDLVGPDGTGPSLAGPDLIAYARGRAAENDGHPATAAAAYAAALAARPDDALIARRAYREALDAGDMPLALRAADTLRRAGKAPPDAAMLDLAQAIASGDDAARTAAVGRLDATAFDFVAPAIRAWLAFDRGEASPVLLDRVDGNSLASRTNIENRALLLIATGKTAEGIMTLQALTGADGAGLNLRIDAAQLLAGAGHADTGRVLLHSDPLVAARLGDGVKPSAAFGVSRLLIRLVTDLAAGEPTPLSVALARAALLLEPDNDRARLLLAEALSRAGLNDVALRTLEQIAPGDPDHAPAQDLRVAILSRAGDPARALTAAEAMADAHGATDTDVARFAALLAAAGRPAEAARAYRTAIDRSGDPAPWALYLQLGAALDEARRWPEARKALQRAVQLAPDEPLALNYLGYAQIERGEDVGAARAMLERASGLAPTNSSITDSLGWAYFRTGDADRAVPLLERAAQADPANAAIAEHLGDVYWTRGRRYEARYAWQAAAAAADTAAAARLAGKIAVGP